MSEPTPSQTVGPYFHMALDWESGPIADHEGMRVGGLVLDGNGDAISDAMIETWQQHPPAYARCATDGDGRWHVVVPRAPYLTVHVFARGLLRHLTTRICFDDDAVPQTVPLSRRSTLIAEPDDDGFRFDVRIQGKDETVFFDV